MHQTDHQLKQKYKAFSLSNFRQIDEVKQRLNEKKKWEIEVVGNVFPFKVNNYVIKELIHWEEPLDDPIFKLTFPQRGMLKEQHYERMARALYDGQDNKSIKNIANEIRMDLNPHPAGQQEYSIPYMEGKSLGGMQHKYKETILFFPKEGQTCHAYCSFCFRWPQFVGIKELKFANNDIEMLIQYVRQHPEVSDILITGGDPLIMRTQVLGNYIRGLLAADLPNLQTIRIGTKALSYWPYRFLSDPDAPALLDLFQEVVQSGKALSLMAHFSHVQEFQTDAVKEAIQRINTTGACIRTQSPVLAHINAQPDIWVKMWREQVRFGCVPYYMFVVRDTGAQHHFGIPLAKAYLIFREAYQKLSGLARTVRGPSMSTTPGKIQVLGVKEINGEKVFILQFLQGRNPDWVLRPFFAKYDPKATWLDELKPAFGETQFFFESNEPASKDRVYNFKTEPHCALTPNG